MQLKVGEVGICSMSDSIVWVVKSIEVHLSSSRRRFNHVFVVTKLTVTSVEMLSRVTGNDKSSWVIFSNWVSLTYHWRRVLVRLLGEWLLVNVFIFYLLAKRSNIIAIIIAYTSSHTIKRTLISYTNLSIIPRLEITKWLFFDDLDWFFLQRVRSSRWIRLDATANAWHVNLLVQLFVTMWYLWRCFLALLKAVYDVV